MIARISNVFRLFSQPANLNLLHGVFVFSLWTQYYFPLVSHIALAIFLVLSICHMAKPEPNSGFTLSAFGLLSLYLVFLLSGLWSSEIAEYARKLLLFLSLFTFALWSIVLPKEQIRSLFADSFASIFVLCSGLFFSIEYILQFLLNPDIPLSAGKSFIFGFQKHYIAMYAGVATLLSLRFSTSFDARKHTVLYWLQIVSGLVSVSVVLYIQSRIVILALVPCAIILLLPTYQSSFGKRIFAVLLIGTVVMSIVFRQEIQQKWSETSDEWHAMQEETNSEKLPNPRYFLWGLVPEIISSSPWVGHGLGDAQSLLDAQTEKMHIFFPMEEDTYYDFADRNFNYHNQYFEVLIATGWLGFLLLVLTLGAGFYTSFSRSRIQGVLLLFLAMNMFTESIWHRQMGVLLFAFFYYLCTVLAWSKPTISTTPNILNTLHD